MRDIILYCMGMVTAATGSVAYQSHEETRHALAFSAREDISLHQPAEPIPTIGRANDGLFYVNGATGTSDIRFLVDTGATHIVLSHADAKKIKSSALLREKTGTMMTVGGKITVDWVVIDEIEIAGTALKGLKAAIPRRDIGLSLLGQAGLAQFDRVYIDGDQLTLARHKIAT
jgi:aspartyl protease family protein